MLLIFNRIHVSESKESFCLLRTYYHVYKDKLLSLMIMMLNVVLMTIGEPLIKAGNSISSLTLNKITMRVMKVAIIQRETLGFDDIDLFTTLIFISKIGAVINRENKHLLFIFKQMKHSVFNKKQRKNID
jgi:hypothetical protein